MDRLRSLKILFVAGFGPIVRDDAASGKLYRDVLAIPFKEEAGGYFHSEALPGVKSFALWPLNHAAQSCFGSASWPSTIPIPQAWLEFDVEDVEQASAVLEERGYRLLRRNKKEPWGQIVSRFLSPEGLLVGVTFTPSLREMSSPSPSRPSQPDRVLVTVHSSSCPLVFYSAFILPSHPLHHGLATPCHNAYIHGPRGSVP